MRDCFRPEFYASLETFMDHSCLAGRGVVGIWCPNSASFNASTRIFSASRNWLNLNAFSGNWLHLHTEAKEWDSLVTSIEAEWKQSSSLTTTTPKSVKSLNEEGKFHQMSTLICILIRATESRALSLLRPIIKDLIVATKPHRLPEVMIQIPDDVKYQMKQLKNWRMFHSFLRLNEQGFGFDVSSAIYWAFSVLRPSFEGGKFENAIFWVVFSCNWTFSMSFQSIENVIDGQQTVDWENALLPCETSSGERGLCKSVSRCLHRELYRSRDFFVANSCPRG